MVSLNQRLVKSPSRFDFIPTATKDLNFSDLHDSWPRHCHQRPPEESPVAKGLGPVPRLSGCRQGKLVSGANSCCPISNSAIMNPWHVPVEHFQFHHQKRGVVGFKNPFIHSFLCQACLSSVWTRIHKPIYLYIHNNMNTPKKSLGVNPSKSSHLIFRCHPPRVLRCPTVQASEALLQRSTMRLWGRPVQAPHWMP